MNLKHLFVAAPAALLILGGGSASAGQTIDDVGALACVVDKWDEKEPQIARRDGLALDCQQAKLTN